MKMAWNKGCGHKRAGFTLVELVVVIAILGILAGVGTVAYSGYVEKANKAVDQQLVSDIEYALKLAGYNGTFDEGEGGYLVLSTTGIVNEDAIGTNLDEAMKAAFGDGYKNTLKLTYDGWGNNGLALGLNGDQARAVYNSTYYDVADKLMGQVKQITDAAWNILDTGNTGEPNREQMIEMFSGGSMTLEDAAQTYGYSSLDEVPDSALPNLMVLAVAGDVTMKNHEENEGDWTMSQASGLIQEFSRYNGYANLSPSFATKYENFIAAISAEGVGISGVATAFRELRREAAADSGYATYTAGGQAAKDADAFAAMMNGLTGAAAMNNAGVAEGLSQDDFYTTGLGNSLFLTYVENVESAVNFNDTISNALLQVLANDVGEVAVFYSMGASGVGVGNSLPIG